MRLSAGLFTDDFDRNLHRLIVRNHCRSSVAHAFRHLTQRRLVRWSLVVSQEINLDDTLTRVPVGILRIIERTQSLGDDCVICSIDNIRARLGATGIPLGIRFLCNPEEIEVGMKLANVKRQQRAPLFATQLTGNERHALLGCVTRSSIVSNGISSSSSSSHKSSCDWFRFVVTGGIAKTVPRVSNRKHYDAARKWCGVQDTVRDILAQWHHGNRCGASDTIGVVRVTRNQRVTLAWRVLISGVWVQSNTTQQNTKKSLVILRRCDNMDPQVYRLITIAMSTVAGDTNQSLEDPVYCGVRDAVMELFAQFSAFYPDQFNLQNKNQFLKDCGIFV